MLRGRPIRAPGGAQQRLQVLAALPLAELALSWDALQHLACEAARDPTQLNTRNGGRGGQRPPSQPCSCAPVILCCVFAPLSEAWRAVLCDGPLSLCQAL
jgi:hypothetical protein